MSSPTRQLKQGAFRLGGGHHAAAWRYPDTPAERQLDLGFYQKLARTAEAARFDLLFFADSVAAETGPGAHRAAAGFNLMPARLPHGPGDFAVPVVPGFRSRCLFRRAHAGRTPHVNPGLPRAPHAATRSLS